MPLEMGGRPHPMNERGDSYPPSLTSVREGDTVAGKYVVGRLIMIGGMGAVYEAQDKLLERRVALKVLLPQLVTSPTASHRFLREARAATRITSEHVVKLLDTQLLPDGTPLLVMEYLEGRDLRALLRESGPVPAQTAVDYLLQAVQAVAEGHTQGIVHRDLKPSNLFLTERADGTALIKVLDFGIAKTQPRTPEDLSLTSSEDIRLGSPTYMPPEQFQNPRDVDARADIWALGATLYELISGRVPFRGDTYAELVSQVLSAPAEPLKLADSADTLPDGLDAIVRKCLEKKREQRFASGVELAVALAPFGSADARLSLTRVSGLTRPRSPNPAGPGRDTIGAYEATLPVPPEAVHRTPSAARAKRRMPRLLGIAGALALALIFGLLIWKGGTRASNPLQPARAVSTSFAAAQAALPPSAPLVVPDASPPPVAVLTPAPPEPASAKGPSKPLGTQAARKAEATLPAEPKPPAAIGSAEPKNAAKAAAPDRTLQQVEDLVLGGDRRSAPH